MNYKQIYQSIFFFTVWLQIYIEEIRADCDNALGMESGIIKDDQIHASHWLYRNAHYKASYARLNLTSASGSWCSADIQQKKNQYIQIDLLKNTKLTAIATQGRHNSVEFIEAFQIKYQRDNENFFRNYEETQGTWKKFTGNKDNQDIVKNIFKHPIIARTVRVYPRGEEFAIYCTRLELYGCKWKHEQTAVKKYTSPYGTEKQDVDMRDSTYDGNLTNTSVFNGLGKLTDDIYGGKNSQLGGNGSPWVAYNTKSPEIKFVFQKKKVIEQIMIHVNNNNNDIKIFSKVDIYVSLDDVKYNRVKQYTTNDDQHKKIDAFPVVINLEQVVAKYVSLQFTKRGDWLLLSEILFMTDTFPPKQVAPSPTSSSIGDNNNNNNNNGITPVFTLPSDITSNENENSIESSEESKGLSFPIILTIALVTIVLAVVVAIVVYKSYRKNRKQDSIRCNIPSQTQFITADPKQDVGLLYDERMMAVHTHHPNQPPTIISTNGMYMHVQPMLQGNGVYNTQMVMS